MTTPRSRQNQPNLNWFSPQTTGGVVVVVVLDVVDVVLDVGATVVVVVLVVLVLVEVVGPAPSSPQALAKSASANRMTRILLIVHLLGDSSRQGATAVAAAELRRLPFRSSFITQKTPAVKCGPSIYLLKASYSS